jgi:hypothetical protein
MFGAGAPASSKRVLEAINEGIGGARRGEHMDAEEVVNKLLAGCPGNPGKLSGAPDFRSTTSAFRVDGAGSNPGAGSAWSSVDAAGATNDCC